MINRKKVLITGGDGFLGKVLKKKLEKNYDIILFGPKQGKDVVNYEGFRGLKADYVVHLAAVIKTNDLDLMNRVNTEGTKNVLKFCEENKARLIFSSSGGVYGNGKSPLKENYLLYPLTDNGKAKKKAEEMCKNHYIKTKRGTVILRIFNIYGGGQKKGFLIPDIVSQIGTGKIFLGNPHPKRDYIHVEDIADAIEKSLELDGFNILNIGSGKSHSVEEIAKMLTNEPLEFKDKSPDDSDIYCDNSQAEEKLGWTPRKNLEHELKEIVKEKICLLPQDDFFLQKEV